MNDATRALNPELFPADPARRMLDEHEAATRTNWSNDGRAFQKEIERTGGGYHSRRIASYRKVDPPVRIVWPYDARVGRKVQRVIFQTNPWLDFVGCWSARFGRALLLEAKSTATHRLPFKRSGGLTEEQVSTIKTWRLAGAATAVLWQWSGRVVLFTPEMLVAADGAGAKSLVFEGGIPVPRGEGSIVWDFLPVLERAIWSEPERTSQ